MALIEKASIESNRSNGGERRIANKKPSRVLFGLTLEMKDLLPNFLPAKNAIESIKTLISIMNNMKTLSLNGPG